MFTITSGQAFLHFMTNYFSPVCSGGEFQMFPLAAQRPLWLVSTVIKQQHLLWYITYNRNITEKGTARGCQNIMGLSGVADQGRNARR